MSDQATPATPASPDSPAKQAYSRKRLIYLVFGTVTLLFLGLIYAWSIFANPMADAIGCDVADISATFGILMAAFCIGCLVASVVSRKTSPKVSLFIAAALMFLGFTVTAHFIQAGTFVVFLGHGVAVGLGCGFGYNAIVSTVNRWFPERIGISSGILLLGYGFGTLVLGTPANAAIAEFGLGAVLQTLAVVGLVLLVVMAVLLTVAPADIDVAFPKAPAPDPDSEAQKTPAASKPRASRVAMVSTSSTPVQMLKSRALWLQLIWYVPVTATALILIGQSKQGALGVGVDVAFATLLVGLVSAANGLARPVFGTVHDRFGLPKVTLAITICAFAASLMLLAAVAFAIPALYIVGALLMGFSYGGLPITGTSFAMDRYGPEYYPTNLAIVTACLIPASLVSMFAPSALLGAGGEVALYGAMCIAVVLSGVAWVFYTKQFEHDVAEL